MTDQHGQPVELGPDAAAAPRRGVALATSIDQILSSLSNALLLFTVAQTASVSEFGIVALLVAIVAVWMAFNRGALGVPILLTSDLPARDIRTEAGYAVTWAALTGLGAAASLCIVGAVAGEFIIALMLAIAVPAVLIQDVLRFAAISRGQPLAAALSDGLWTICIASAFLANTSGAAIPATYAVALWGVSGLIAATVLAFSTGIWPQYRRILAWWRTYTRARVHFGIGDAMSPVYTVAVLFAVTVIVDYAVAGSLRGATTLFGPFALLFSALPLVFVPHARRSATTARQQWQSLVKISWLSSALTVGATLALVAIPRGWGVAIMGSTWDSAVAVLPYEGLAVVAAIWMASVYVLLKAQGKSRAAFWTRAIQTLAQFAGCVIAAITVGTAVAIAAASAGLCWATVVISVILAGRVARSATQTVDDHAALATDPTDRPAGGALPRRYQPCDEARDGRTWPVIDVLEGEVPR